MAMVRTAWRTGITKRHSIFRVMVKHISKRSRITSKDTTKKKSSPISKVPKVSHPLRSFNDQILSLQRTLGNQGVERFLSRGLLQTKLKIGQPNDKYEQEADRIADRVMRMPDQQIRSKTTLPFAKYSQRGDEESSSVQMPSEHKPIQTKSLVEQITPLAQRQTEPEEKENAQAQFLQRQEEVQEQPEEEEPVQAKMLQRQEREEENAQAKNINNKSGTISLNVENNINTIRGGGQPLSESTRSFFEPRFGADFSGVKVHTGANANHLTKSINAKAFTIGQDIVFGSGQYSQDSHTGRALLAHELTHVVQQNSGTKSSYLQRSRGIPLVIQRKKEVHVNLRVPQKVKLYEKGGSEQVFSPVSAGKGNLTSRLIKTPTTTYPITKRADPLKKLGKWGLMYFATFSGGIGFHSNICYPLRSTLCGEGYKKYCSPKSDKSKRTKYTLKVDGNPRSHGCVRMLHPASATLFGLIDNGTPVRVYKRKKWRRPLWEGKPKK